MDVGYRLRLLGALAALSGAALMPMPAAAQPSGMPPTLSVVVGFAPGGGTDLVARIWADAMREQLKTNVVVENKPGAGGAIAAQQVVNAPATQPSVLLAIDHQTSILQNVMKNPGFNAERDLLPLGRVVTYEVCLAVNAGVAARTLAEYGAAAKTDPQLANIAVPAPGSNAQFIGHAVLAHYGVKMVAVPYRGAAPALSDLAGGQVKAAVMPCDAFFGFVRNGTVRVLAVVGDKRSTRLPDVPSLQESGITVPGLYNFLGAYAPRGTDARLVAALTAATRDMFGNPATVERLNATGMFAAYAPPEDLARYARDATAFWAEQVKSSGFNAE